MIRFPLFVVLLIGILPACGDAGTGDTGTSTGEPREPEPLVEQASFTLSGAAHTADDGTYTLYKTPQCKLNTDTGILVMEYSHLGTTLKIEVKNYSSSPKAYTCAQQQNNTLSVDSIGDRFTGCSVAMRLNNINEELNGYDMYRSSTSMTLFRYNDSCQVDITSSGQSVSGTFSCGSMPQTYYDGLRRNPIDPGNNADASGTFGCELSQN